jgi:hypothetical protein
MIDEALDKHGARVPPLLAVHCLWCLLQLRRLHSDPYSFVQVDTLFLLELKIELRVAPGLYGNELIAVL